MVGDDGAINQLQLQHALPTTAIDQGGPASSQFNRLNPPTSCLQVQHTTHRLQEWRRTAACPEMSTLLITFRQKTHWQRIIPQSIKKFPLSPNSTRMPREPGWARRSWKRAGWDLSLSHAALYLHLHHGYIHSPTIQILDCYPVCARSALAQRACALGAKGLLLADGAPTVGRGKTF